MTTMGVVQQRRSETPEKNQNNYTRCDVADDLRRMRRDLVDVLHKKSP